RHQAAQPRSPSWIHSFQLRVKTAMMFEVSTCASKAGPRSDRLWSHACHPVDHPWRRPSWGVGAAEAGEPAAAPPGGPTRPCRVSWPIVWTTGRRIRILTVEDVFTRECLAVEVDTW